MDILIDNDLKKDIDGNVDYIDFLSKYGSAAYEY